MPFLGNLIARALVCLFCLSLSLPCFTANALAQSATGEVVLGPWQVRHPTPTDSGRGLAHDGQKYVLVDGYGGIYTSISGWNWTRQPAPTVSALSSIAHGSNVFVAVGLGGSILTSTNGTNWVQLPSPVTNDLDRIIFANDRFTTVGQGGTVLTSIDGLRFTQLPSPVTNWLHDITAGPGTLVAVGGENTILVSTNSLDWIKAAVTNTPIGATITIFRGSLTLRGTTMPALSFPPTRFPGQITFHSLSRTSSANSPRPTASSLSADPTSSCGFHLMAAPGA